MFTVTPPSNGSTSRFRSGRLMITGPHAPTASAGIDTGGRARSPIGGLSVAVTGPAGYTADANTAAAGIDGRLLAAAATVGQADLPDWPPSLLFATWAYRCMSCQPSRCSPACRLVPSGR